MAQTLSPAVFGPHGFLSVLFFNLIRSAADRRLDQYRRHVGFAMSATWTGWLAEVRIWRECPGPGSFVQTGPDPEHYHIESVEGCREAKPDLFLRVVAWPSVCFVAPPGFGVAMPPAASGCIGKGDRPFGFGFGEVLAWRRVEFLKSNFSPDDKTT